MCAGIVRWARTVCFLLTLEVFYYYVIFFVLLGWAFTLESFSPLLQICCNHEFNILSTAFNGMQFKLLTCLINNLFTTNNFWIANGWISIWKWSSVFHSISLQFQWRLRMLLGILVWYLIVLTCIINGSGFGSPNI